MHCDYCKVSRQPGKSLNSDLIDVVYLSNMRFYQQLVEAWPPVSLQNPTSSTITL